MNRKYAFFCAILLCSLILVFAVSTVLAQGGGFDLSWNVLAPGGAASGGAYTLNSAIGQPFAGSAGAGSYSLCAGYLCGVPSEAHIYLPVVTK